MIVRYWSAEAAETDSTRIRDTSDAGALSEEVMAPLVELVGARSTFCLLM